MSGAGEKGGRGGRQRGGGGRREGRGEGEVEGTEAASKDRQLVANTMFQWGRP